MSFVLFSFITVFRCKSRTENPVFIRRTNFIFIFRERKCNRCIFIAFSFLYFQILFLNSNITPVYSITYWFSFNLIISNSRVCVCVQAWTSAHFTFNHFLIFEVRECIVPSYCSGKIQLKILVSVFISLTPRPFVQVYLTHTIKGHFIASHKYVMFPLISRV